MNTWAALAAMLFAGLPLGLPPGEEDPMMARIAPDECILYLSWSGSKSPDAADANHVEQLLAEPEIQLLLTKVESLIVDSIMREAEENGPEATFASREGTKWSRKLLTRPGALFLASVDILPDGPLVEGGLVSNLGADAAELSDLLKKIKAEMAGDAMDEVQVGGVTMYRVQPGPGAPPITFGVKETYFYVGIGEQAVERILKRADTEPPAWLTGLREELAVKRPSFVGYVNTASVFEKIRPFVLGNPEGKAIWNVVGIDNISSIGFVCGLDEQHSVTRTLIGVDGKLTGVLSSAEGQPLTAADLATIPRDANLAVAFRLNADDWLAAILAALDRVDPNLRREFEQGIAQGEDEIGVRLRDDVLRSLGDVWSIYHSSGEGGLIGGLTGVVKVKDRDALAAVQKKLVDSYKAAEETFRDEGRRFGGMPALRNFKFAEQEVYYVAGGEMPVSPSWCLTEDELIVGLYPQNIKAYLGRGDDFQSLATLPDVAKLFEDGKGPIKVYYQNTPELFELGYPFVQLGLRYMFAELQREGIDIDMSIVPSGQSIRRHLRADVTSVVRTEKGIEVTCQQSFPGTGSFVPLAVLATGFYWTASVEVGSAPVFDGFGALLPSRRDEMRSMNNLKQIGLALHNYHDVYRKFPPAAPVNGDGKPMLSWRVHILPFAGEPALYDRFRLDEPWDSEHNKALIPLMPDVFKAPGSNAEAGMTNYVAPRGEHTVFPGAEGTFIGRITDGTSNTIMVVEADDMRAVTWTKPDDLTYDDMAPTRGLVGLRRDGFLTLFADGYVRKIVGTIDKETLNRLFSRDDGQPIDPEDFDARPRRPRRARPVPTAIPRAIDEEGIRELDVPREPEIRAEPERAEPPRPRSPSGAASRR